MKLSIGTNIQRLRRARGLTQEQLADAVGVSAAAVSKWETGAACPDLFLLAPLARLLGTDLNQLMDFQPQLTDREAQGLLHEYRALFESGRTAEAAGLCKKLLHQYPNDLWLKFYLASLFLTHGQDTDQVILLLEACLSSADETLRVNAAYVLASLLCHGPRQDLERARQLLDEISFPDPDVRALRMTLLAEQGSWDQAEQLACAALEEHLSDAMLCLQFLAKGARLQNDLSRAREFLDKAERLGETAPVPCFAGLLSVRVVSVLLYCEVKDKERALQEMERMVVDAQDWADASGQSAQCRYTLRTLARTLKDSSELALLQEEPRFSAALDKLTF